jgi:hypothetical protein
MWAADFAGTGLHPGCTSTPVLDFDGGVYTAGVLVKYADGRESLAFTFDCASWTPTCLLLGHFSLTWMLRDIVPGERQALLSPQVRALIQPTGLAPRLGAACSNSSIPCFLAAPPILG